MQVTELKTRAKRLRSAMQSVVGVQITASQAFELVAKEESYPNWDAACGCAEKMIANRSDNIQSRRYLDIADVSLTNSRVVVMGLTGSGRTTLALAIARELSVSLSKTEFSFEIVVISRCREYPNDRFMSTNDPSFASDLASLDLSQSVVIIDDVFSHQLFGSITEQFWTDIGNRSGGVVITVHGCADEQIPVCLQSGYQLVNCMQHILSTNMNHDAVWIDVEENHADLKGAFNRALHLDPMKVVIVGSAAEYDTVMKQAGLEVEVLPAGTVIPATASVILPLTQ